MSLDIRTPIGLMFAIIGLILAVFGAATIHSPIYARSLGYNVNLCWGCALLAFGIIMLLMARRAKRRAAKHDDPRQV
jgi:hypothetical protein